MDNVLRYKDYIGTLEYSEEDGVFYGKVIGIRSLISYEGEDAKSLIRDFHEAVDAYILLCEETGEEPEKPYKGGFNVRLTPELHKQAAVYSLQHGLSLNAFVKKAIERELAMK